MTRVGDRLVELLIEYGVDRVFGVPGGQTLPLYEGIRKQPDKIQHVLMRDERSAGYAADAYARLTGRTGVCDATVGPGATNLVSPLAEAHCSSIPLLAVIADIPRKWEHRRSRGNASQALQQLDIFRTVSKWQTTVSDPESLDDIIDAAFRTAVTGKPGPVVVAIPDDVWWAEIKSNRGIKTPMGAAFPRFRAAPDPRDIKKAGEWMANSKRPAMVVGGGAHISGAYEQVRTLADRLRSPVITTISGKGIVEETHETSFGVAGTFGNPIANNIMHQADLVLFVGSKVGQITTLGYQCPGRDVPIIHLDIDPEEIGRNYGESLPLLADARLGLEALIDALGERQPQVDWDFNALKEDHQRWYRDMTYLPQNKSGDPLRPQAVMDAVNKAVTERDVVVCDASLSSGWAAAFLQLATTGRRYIAPRGLAGLGWGAGAAVGAALAGGPEKRILHFAGDGGFSYSVQELEVMSRLGLPVVNIIFNNDVLGWIKHVQKDFYKEQYFGTDYSHIDFATVAKGFGVRSTTVRTMDELNACLSREESPKGPVVIEVISDQWETPVCKPPQKSDDQQSYGGKALKSA
ncbi:MAG: thiamine pyrophosphate-binding protein [Proteobacteria bacterium]|nr:thiamine pyrophosphate-binding protein [Pseudomonadota bacterium]